MLTSDWIYKKGSGVITNSKDLVEVLARAPESLLSTDLMKTLVEDFYEV